MSSSSWYQGIREEVARARREQGDGAVRGVGLFAIKLIRDTDDGEQRIVGAVRMRLAQEDSGAGWEDWDLSGNW